MSKIIGLTNEKGGVGKTTLATHIAAGLARRGDRVLILDTDSQEANATFFCGLSPYSGFYDLMVRDADWQTVIRPVPPHYYTPDGETTLLSICGSNIETRNIPLLVDDAYLLADRLAELELAFEWIVIDTSPTPGLLATAINIAAHYVIYPTELEVPSVTGLKASINHRQRVDRMSNVQAGGIVPMMARLNTWEHQGVYEHLKEQFGDLVWTPIPQSIVWAEANGARTSVYAYDPSHAAIADLEAVVSRVRAFA